MMDDFDPNDRMRELGKSMRIRQEIMALSLIACDLTEEEFQKRLAELRKLEDDA